MNRKYVTVKVRGFRRSTSVGAEDFLPYRVHCGCNAGAEDFLPLPGSLRLQRRAEDFLPLPNNNNVINLK
jgi:hypothetical protein